MKRLLLFLSLPFLATAGELKVASYNVRMDTAADKGARDWSQRLPGVVSFLKDGGFTIMGLQEVKHKQLGDLQKALPNLRHVGVGRDDGKQGGEYAPLFYDPAVWTVDEQEQGTFWLSETPEVAGSKGWGNEVTRICSWARLIGADGKAIYAFNTHWDHRSQAFREKAATMILARIKGRKHGGDAVILMGDFNSTTENPAIKALLKSGLLVDHGGAEQMISFNRWKPGLKPGLRIDHIFTSPFLPKGVFAVRADGDPVNSDHQPVVLTIPANYTNPSSKRAE